MDQRTYRLKSTSRIVVFSTPDLSGAGTIAQGKRLAKGAMGYVSPTTSLVASFGASTGKAVTVSVDGGALTGFIHQDDLSLFS